MATSCDEKRCATCAKCIQGDHLVALWELSYWCPPEKCEPEVDYFCNATCLRGGSVCEYFSGGRSGPHAIKDEYAPVYDRSHWCSVCGVSLQELEHTWGQVLVAGKVAATDDWHDHYQCQGTFCSVYCLQRAQFEEDGLTFVWGPRDHTLSEEEEESVSDAESE